MILGAIAKPGSSFTTVYHLSLIFEYLAITFCILYCMTHRITHNNTSKVLFIARDVSELIIQPRAIDRNRAAARNEPGSYRNCETICPISAGARAHKRNLSRLTSFFLLLSLYVDVTKGRAVPRGTRDYTGRTCLARRKRAFCPRRN